MEPLKFKALTDGAKLPNRATKKSAGYDLYSMVDIQVDNFATPVPTGVAVEIPEGYYGQIAPRSGLAVKFGIDTMAGVIDGDYRGELKVILNAPNYHNIKKGDKIAQLLIIPCYMADTQFVDELSEQEKHDGFGSTGN